MRVCCQQEIIDVFKKTAKYIFKIYDLLNESFCMHQFRVLSFLLQNSFTNFQNRDHSNFPEN